MPGMFADAVSSVEGLHNIYLLITTYGNGVCDGESYILPICQDSGVSAVGNIFNALLVKGLPTIP